jgi:hypothetical protein
VSVGMVVQRWWSDDRRNPKYSEKTQFNAFFCTLDPQLEWPGIESRSVKLAGSFLKHELCVLWNF